MKYKKYRVVRDTYNGYEVQTWRAWFPFWIQGKVNSHTSLELAKKYIEGLKRTVVYKE